MSFIASDAAVTGDEAGAAFAAVRCGEARLGRF